MPAQLSISIALPLTVNAPQIAATSQVGAKSTGMLNDSLIQIPGKSLVASKTRALIDFIKAEARAYLPGEG